MEFNIVRLDNTVSPEKFQTDVDFEDFKILVINLLRVPPALRENVELGYRYPSGKSLRGPVMSFKNALLWLEQYRFLFGVTLTSWHRLRGCPLPASMQLAGSASQRCQAYQLVLA